MSELTLPQVYRNTIAVIERRGWCSGTFVTRAGRVCLIAALAEAAGAFVDPGGSPVIVWDGVPEEASDLFEQAADGIASMVLTMPAMWNDMHGRTVDEVKALLLRAAEEAERRG